MTVRERLRAFSEVYLPYITIAAALASGVFLIVAGG